MHLIIVEGPDGAGKTTLIDKLLEANKDAVSLHFSKPVNEEEAYNYWQIYARRLEEYAETDKLVIFDRSWYSDLVYGKVMRGRQEMSEMMVSMLEAKARCSGSVMIIYCKAPLNILWRRCTKRGETYITSKDKLAEIAEAYERVMTEVAGLPVITYNTNG